MQGWKPIRRPSQPAGESQNVPAPPSTMALPVEPAPTEPTPMETQPYAPLEDSQDAGSDLAREAALDRQMAQDFEMAGLVSADSALPSAKDWLVACWS